MMDHLVPQPVLRELGVICGSDAGAAHLLNPTVEVCIIPLQCIGLYIVQNLTLAQAIVGQQCLLELVSDCCHLVGCATEKDWGTDDLFFRDYHVI